MKKYIFLGIVSVVLVSSAKLLAVAGIFNEIGEPVEVEFIFENPNENKKFSLEKEVN